MNQLNFGFWQRGEYKTGDRITLNINDPALLYGATHFTTLRIYNQSLTDTRTQWTQHLQRLNQTPSHFTAPNWQSITQGAEFLSKHYDILRITLFPDGSELITGRSLPPDLHDRQTQGIHALLLDPSQTRSLPQFKTGNYLAPWLALKDAQENHCAEAIFTNHRGDWLETSTGNLWGYTKGNWYTPPLSAGILPGIQRSRLINLLKSQNQSVQEINWSSDLIAQFECIGYSNCVIELIPIHVVIHQNSIVKNYSFSQNSMVVQTLQRSIHIRNRTGIEQE